MSAAWLDKNHRQSSFSAFLLERDWCIPSSRTSRAHLGSW